MALDFSSWMTSVTTICNINDDFGLAAFTALVDRYIERATLYMLRDPDFDFLATRTIDITKQTAAGVRSVGIPTELIIVEGVSLITPANTKPPAGKRIRLLRMDKDWCDLIWPTQSDMQAPAEWQTYWALYSMFGAASDTANGQGPATDEAAAMPSPIIIAPTPDAAYVVEFSGVMRPPMLSATVSETFLTRYLPDLFLAASVVAVAGFQRDFASGNPGEGQGLADYWEAEYRRLKTGAAVENARQAARSVGWSANVPAVLAGMPRGGLPPGPAQGG